MGGTDAEGGQSSSRGFSSQRIEPDVVERDLAVIHRLTEIGPSDSVVPIESGWTSRVYVLDHGRLVVKFPRAPEVKSEYRREVEILQSLNAFVFEVDLPRVRSVGDDCEYIVFDGVEGIDFSTIAAQLAQVELRGVGQSIGRFLKALHALDLHNAQRMTIEQELNEYQAKYRLGLRAYEERLTPGERARLRWLMEQELPSRAWELGGDLVFSHGDLGYWNMILPSHGRLGVIDFGDAGYYDRSKDFVGLEHADLLDAALRVYGDDSVLREKIAVRQVALPVIELPFYIGKHDDAGLQRTLTRLRERLSALSA